MNRKGLVLLASLTTICAIASTVLLANNSVINAGVLAVEPDQWYHYAAVEPTETMHGSKEFWASSSDGCVTHTLEDPKQGTYVERDFSTYESFGTLSNDDDRYIPSSQEALGIVPAIHGDTITYGFYPHTHVNDSALISKLDELFPLTFENDRYLLYNGAYYFRENSGSHFANRVFEDGTPIENNTLYWYECKPITWNILSSNGNSFYAIAQSAIRPFDFNINTSDRTIDDETVHANNYMCSSLRAWLNCYDDRKYGGMDYSTSYCFYNRAFVFGDSYLTTMTVDNSASSTGDLSNNRVCDNTADKVTILSYEEAYEFYGSNDGANDERTCYPTDYARARGIKKAQDSYIAPWWLRSPISNSSNAMYVTTTGAIQSNNNEYKVNNSSLGIRPVVTITIE